MAEDLEMARGTHRSGVEDLLMGKVTHRSGIGSSSHGKPLAADVSALVMFLGSLLLC